MSDGKIEPGDEPAARRALIDAAIALLAEAGPQALSVRGVARRAGVNHGQVHHYFGSKRGLLEAAMAESARAHFARRRARDGAATVPAPLALAEEPGYWRAVCQAVLAGDLELARTEIDAGVSVPRHALHALCERTGIPAHDLDYKARFAALVSLNLGWVAFEDFVRLLVEVDDRDRDEFRERLRRQVGALFAQGTTRQPEASRRSRPSRTRRAPAPPRPTP